MNRLLLGGAALLCGAAALELGVVDAATVVGVDEAERRAFTALVGVGHARQEQFEHLLRVTGEADGLGVVATRGEDALAQIGGEGRLRIR